MQASRGVDRLQGAHHHPIDLRPLAPYSPNSSMRVRKTFVIVLALLACASTAGAQATPKTITGKVTDGGTGERLAGVKVTIRPNMVAVIPTSRADYENLTKSYQAPALTNERGEFSVSGVPAGSYGYDATLKGYALPQGSGRLFSVPSDGPVPELTIVMVKAVAVDGVVEDSDRNPVPKAAVQLIEVRIQGGERAAIPAYIATADDAGHFVFPAVSPAVYYLQAGPEKRTSLNPNVPPPALAETFYVQSTELDAATPSAFLPASTRGACAWFWGRLHSDGSAAASRGSRI